MYVQEMHAILVSDTMTIPIIAQHHLIAVAAPVSSKGPAVAARMPIHGMSRHVLITGTADSDDSHSQALFDVSASGIMCLSTAL